MKQRPGGDEYVWRFVEGGTAVHALRAPIDEVALCGLSEHPVEWRGTGSQEEYDAVDSLATCRRCRAVIIRGGAVTPELV